MIASREWNLTKRTGSRQRLAQFLNVGRDDYGQIIEQQDLSDIPDTSDQSLISASDPVLPSPAEHPGNWRIEHWDSHEFNRRRSTVDSGNGNQTQSDATADAEIGMGDFVTDKPRKTQKIKKSGRRVRKR